MSKTKDEIHQEIIDSCKGNFHGLFTLAPRVGKTKLGIMMLREIKPKKVLWVTPSAKLRDIDIPAEFVKWKAKVLLRKVETVCWASLNKVKGKYDVIILDEYQDITADNASTLLKKELIADTIICLSGTHPTHEEKNDIYKKLNLTSRLTIDIEEAIDLGLIADYDVEVVQCSLNSSIKSIKAGSKEKPFMQTERASYDYLTSLIDRRRGSKFTYLSRMRLIHNSINKADAARKLRDKLLEKGRVLMFCSNKQQAENLSPYVYHSSTTDEDLNLFQKGEIDLLACVNSGGVGYTFTNFDFIIIVQSDSDNKGLTTQKICRALVEQGNYKAKVYIICASDTVDSTWVNKTLESFNKDKVVYTNIIDYV